MPQQTLKGEEAQGTGDLSGGQEGRGVKRGPEQHSGTERGSGDALQVMAQAPLLMGYVTLGTISLCCYLIFEMGVMRVLNP